MQKQKQMHIAALAPYLGCHNTELTASLAQALQDSPEAIDQSDALVNLLERFGLGACRDHRIDADELLATLAPGWRQLQSAYTPDMTSLAGLCGVDLLREINARLVSGKHPLRLALFENTDNDALRFLLVEAKAFTRLRTRLAKAGVTESLVIAQWHKAASPNPHAGHRITSQDLLYVLCHQRVLTKLSYQHGEDATIFNHGCLGFFVEYDKDQRFHVNLLVQDQVLLAKIARDHKKNPHKRSRWMTVALYADDNEVCAMIRPQVETQFWSHCHGSWQPYFTPDTPVTDAASLRQWYEQAWQALFATLPAPVQAPRPAGSGIFARLLQVLQPAPGACEGGSAAAFLSSLDWSAACWGITPETFFFDAFCDYFRARQWLWIERENREDSTSVFYGAPHALRDTWQARLKQINAYRGFIAVEDLLSLPDATDLPKAVTGHFALAGHVSSHSRMTPLPLTATAAESLGDYLFVALDTPQDLCWVCVKKDQLTAFKVACMDLGILLCHPF